MDCPGGTVEKNLPANSGDTYSSLAQEDPHDTEQLSACATTDEPASLDPVLSNKRSHHDEKPAYYPTSHDWRKPMHSKKDPAWPK